MHPSDFQVLRVEIEPVKLARKGGGGPVRVRGALFLLPPLLLACTERNQAANRTEGDVAPPLASSVARDSGHATYTLQTAVAPPSFRPFAFTDSGTLWGIQRGRLARVRLRDGRLELLRHSAWSVSGARGVVSWTNETGAWALRGGESQPRQLAGMRADVTGFDGPPQVLWSPDGRTALLSWTGEWDYHHELLAPDGSRRPLDTGLDGYMLDRAVLWLDSRTLLFQVRARAPRGGAPEYAESGWRGDLAMLGLPDPGLTRVTEVEDGRFLEVAGFYRGGVLVSERDRERVRAQWLYRPGTWEREPADLPLRRVIAAGDAALVLEETSSPDVLEAFLVTRGARQALGEVDAAELPVVSRDGARIALRRRTASGAWEVVVLRGGGGERSGGKDPHP